jgi:sulfur-carrier protein adenylyltransferase/sulfurtransferase
MNGSIGNIPSITPQALKEALDSGAPIQLIDVREEFERQICSLGGELIPMKTVLEQLDRVPREGKVVVYCRSGGRSGKVVAELIQNHGYTNLFNLSGGVLRWSDDVDPEMPKY